MKDTLEETYRKWKEQFEKKIRNSKREGKKSRKIGG